MSKRTRKCGHRSRYVVIEPWVNACSRCGAVGVHPLGPANDSNPQHADEVHAAQFGSASQWTREADLRIDEDGWISPSFDGDGWTWDPTRPLAGQYEEWEARQRRAIAGETAARHAERDHE